MSTRWIPSSRNRPCPVCGRHTDGKCRRSLDLIDCWVGDRFRPPSNLLIGDVLEVEGQPWALVSTAAGFGGNSYRFRPHRGRPPRPGRRRPSRRAMQRQQEQRQQRQDKALSTVDALRSALHRSLAAIDPLHQSLDAFQVDLGATRQAWELLEAAEAVAQEGAELPRAALAIWRRLLGYQLRDLEHWNRWALGTPTPADLADLSSEALAKEVAA